LITVLHILWLLVELVGYCLAFLVVLAATTIVILAPWVVAGRWAWKRWA
jgi:hypothetical protein